ncbi:MAG: hypothetical protein JWM82_1786 [Myxococcales bacterium]|nr:hypothetical protein [Myxococcales bacterium]
MEMAINWTRRQVLKGAGVALSVPWLETFAPRTARAQAAAAKKRYISFYQPNGTAQYWMPTGAGAGAGWTLSPLLQPLAALKAKMMVFKNVGNAAPYSGLAYTLSKGLGTHGADGATTWTAVGVNGPNNNNNGISVDQVAANLLAAGSSKTYLPSLQVGLSTHDSYGDGLPFQHSRSISWKSPTEPLYKQVNPQAVYDQLVAGRPASSNMMTMVDPTAERRRLLRKSALDYILESSTSLKLRLSTTDKTRLDQFMSTVQTLETRVATAQASMPGVAVMGCPPSPARAAAPISVGMTPGGYNRGEHADVMINLMAMAIQCDITRVISFMIDDCRSEFVYNFLNERSFTPTGSAPNPMNLPVGEYHALQHSGDRNNNITPGFATIGWWNSTKVAQLAALLDATNEGGTTALDNTVLMFASGMHGGDHLNTTLPVAILGGGALGLKQDTFVDSGAEIQLSDVHFSILQKVFGYPGASFGVGKTLVPAIFV